MSHSFLAIRVLRSVPARLWLSSFLLLLGCVWLIPHGDFRQAESFPDFCIGIGLMSAGFVLSWGLRSIPGVWFWGMTILARILLLPMYPGDDVWRYLWEGYIQTLGFSPYHFAPNAIELIPYRTEWWSQINHLDVSAIYPPIAQLGFRVLAFISPTVLLFKLAFVFADLSICWLLSRQFGNCSTLLYAWNPLILYSFAGAAHYDSWFMLPLVAAWLMGHRMESSGQLGKVKPEVEQPNADRLWMGSAFLVGISIAIKWMSLPVLGFLSWQAWKRGGVKRVGWVILCGGLPLVLSVLPFCQVNACPLIPTDSVFVSYGRSAEFVPHILGLLWQPSKQVNWIYAVPLGLSTLWLLWRSQRFVHFAEGYLVTLLILSPIIHAWYFTWIIPFATVTNNLGIRFVSVSAFVYFVLPHRLSLGNSDWFLSSSERLILWLPFLLGWLWSVLQQRSGKQ